ncbi:CHAT domain-containing protein [Streptosporangium sp. LJ11]|uniref:CHAT domain-containing protein n=1 Tax=Streptosporangium sp. LJ11 TaxID=3436927 RepID=UPI003F7A9A04
MRNDVIALMQGLYYDGDLARLLLVRIGMRPAQIPTFRTAETFWPEVVLRLENGLIKNGILLLLEAAEKDHPGNAEISYLIIRIKALSGGDATGPVRVLCLFADPLDRSKIRLAEEARLLQEIADRGGIDLRIRYAVRVADIIRMIISEKPQILHFAGHGGQSGLLVFGDDRGGVAPVRSEDFAGAVAATVGVLDCVVLNSCFTTGNAHVFRGATRAVAGSATSIDDRCALAFARGFYTGVAAGMKIHRAYETGVAEMKLGRCDVAGMHFFPFGEGDR